MTLCVLCSEVKVTLPDALEKVYLVAEADGQLVERYRMRTVGSEEHLELDRLVHMETGRLELGLTLDWSQTGKQSLKNRHISVLIGMCATLNIALGGSLSASCFRRLSVQLPKKK